MTADTVLADGPSTSQGEIALGKNILVGFMTWEGYNYEDAILLNERLSQDDIFTSIHIEEHEIDARDTKLGPEEITRDIPGVGDDALKYLDERGIICIGAEVRAGDILVGKVTPKGETDLTAEERLLRAIFGEKAREVRDTSMKVPHGESGIVVDVKVFTRENGDELSPGVNMVVRCLLRKNAKSRSATRWRPPWKQGCVSRIMPREDMPFMPDGTPLDIVLNPLGVPSRIALGQVLEVHHGYAARALGWKVATPIFDSANENDLWSPSKWRGSVRTERAYFMTAARELPSTAPLQSAMSTSSSSTIWWTIRYTLAPRAPIHCNPAALGRQAQFGGQRFGEMEVWALEAYGAAYTLQEI